MLDGTKVRANASSSRFRRKARVEAYLGQAGSPLRCQPSRRLFYPVVTPFIAKNSTSWFSDNSSSPKTTRHGTVPNLLDGTGLYSARRATSGSTFVARRAGMEHASRAMLTKVTAAAAKVAGSVGVTPKSPAAITRVRAIAAGIPMATPITANTRPCRSISANTSVRV